ncbi:MAG: O-antigen ligase family protein, partial [Planctomycetes bacterium]|nr:O-antigen ligase family protein [Planctomycetota bacterium]
MRTVAITAFILFIIVYAQRDWFRALCCLVVFTALTEYPGLPNPLDAKGINHWSVMFAAIVFAWLLSRVVRPRPWNIPRGWLIVVGLYLLLEMIAITRLCFNLDEFKARASLLNPGYAYYTVRAVIVDCLYSPVRFLLMGFLLLDGVRNRRDLLYGLLAVVGAVVVYALVVDKEIPLRGLAGGGMEFRHRISKWTNRHPNDLAQDFVAVFWIVIGFIHFKLGRRSWRLVALGAAAAILIGLGHTHSRSGFLAFIFVGLAVGFVTKSGRLLVCLTGSVVAVVLFAPSITERIIEGIDRSGFGDHNIAEVAAGRDTIWPAAINGISEQPLLGYGRYGYITSAAFNRSSATGGGELHPHNGFLEAALDHGVIGAALIL